MSLHKHLHVHATRHGLTHRREFLKAISLGGLIAGSLSWSDVMSLNAAELRRQGRACILLWMQGGPSQFETFSPKEGHANGGETKAISTAVPGLPISENLPLIADSMKDICLIRSMTGKEGSHPRATYLLHTAHLPTASVKYPTLGSHVAQHLGEASFDLPGYVRIGRSRDAGGAGLLGVQFDPYVVTDPNEVPQNTEPPGGEQRYRRRLKLLGKLEGHFSQTGGSVAVSDHEKLYDSTSRMVLSPKMETFDLSHESDKVRESYGTSDFGAGCLLARRLIEAGVTFVEVAAGSEDQSGNWDTHENNFERTRELCTRIDQPVATLIRDLKDRGLFDRTLIVWMGEFGRTPKINARGGRDHYPRAFNVALAGAGVRGGQVIGATDDGGVEVTDRPTTVSDLFRTIFTTLGINPDHENMSSSGRPIKLVDGGTVIEGVL